MAAGPKLIADRTEHGAETGRVPEALEPLQTALTPPDGLMRILDAVVLAPVVEMGDGWQRDGFRGSIARQRSVTMAHGTIWSPFKSLRKSRFAARALRWRCTMMSSTSPASSTARHSQPRFPLIIRQSSSRCQMFEHAPRARLRRRAYSRPNRSVQSRMVSYETSMSRASISSETSRRLTPKR
jgi:hypothetical protein